MTIKGEERVLRLLVEWKSEQGMRGRVTREKSCKQEKGRGKHIYKTHLGSKYTLACLLWDNNNIQNKKVTCQISNKHVSISSN